MGLPSDYPVRIVTARVVRRRARHALQDLAEGQTPARLSNRERIMSVERLTEFVIDRPQAVGVPDRCPRIGRPRIRRSRRDDAMTRQLPWESATVSRANAASLNDP